MGTTQVGLVWNPSKVDKETLETALESAIETVLEAALESALELAAGATLQDAQEIRMTWHETSEDDPGRGAAQAALAAGATVVFAAGGDGTIRAVAEHLAESGADADLGIIPLGTGNLLARNLEVPLGDLPAAMTRALEGESRTIDIGWAEVTIDGASERHAFAVMAGFGIDAHMITETDDDLKSKAGWLAYVESLGRALSASEVIDVRLTAGDGDPVDEQAHTLIIGNCGTLQGGLTLLPDADPADGELDLLVLNADSISGWADTMRNLVWDNGLRRLLSKSSGDSAQSSDSATHRRITKLVIELDEAREFEVDGDTLGKATRIEIEVQPAAVRVR